MKMKEAMNIITANPKGFMVHFERVKGRFLESDYFPDKHAGESLIKNEGEAWNLAEQFAKKTVGRCVNIYVIDENFASVADYAKRTIKNR